MQDQGRRLLIAVALALGVMFLWQSFLAPKHPEKKPDATQTGSAAGSAAPAGSAAGSAALPPSAVGVSTQPGAPAAPPSPPRGPEQLIKLEFPNVQATFSSYGGVLSSWHLTDKRYDREKPSPGGVARGQLLPKQGAFAVNFANSTYVLPADTEWVGQKVSDREIVYTYKSDTLQIEKRFVLVPEAFIVKASVSVKANVPAGTEAREQLALTVYGFQDPKDSGGGSSKSSVAPRRWDSGTYRKGTHVETAVTSVLKKPRYEYDITWTGFEHPFMMVGVAPRPTPGTTVDKQTFAEADGLMRTDMIFSPATSFRTGSQPVVHEVVAYLGPKNYNSLEDADKIAGFSTHFVDTINLGWFAFIGTRLMWLLLQFYALLQNWGLTIMLLTICIKGLTIPLVTKSMRGMKAMAVLTPELKALQEKYKDDKQRLQMETMALYKQHGANPFTSCLPLLLQTPIWLALYRMLSSTGELYQQPFIPGWIDDLTAADPYYVLPIILVVTMFVQARLQPMGPVTDSSQKMQQNLMKYGLPLMFGVMSFFFPAGLTLYIFTNTVLSALHSIYMNKFDKKSIALQAKIKAAQEAAAAAKINAAAAKAKPANPAPDSDAPSSSSGPARPKRKKPKRR
jgi:YidC/Oxa1 family membrane protein insertase